MTDERVTFAKRLRELREERGLRQVDLADRAGLTASAISQFEGQSREPSFSSIVKLAHALEVSPSYLAGLEEYELDEETRAFYRELEGLTKKDREILAAVAASLRQQAEDSER